MAELARRAMFTLEAADGAARAGTVTLPRGTFDTPCFMPVGTRGAIKHLSAVDVEDLGAQVVLANTYHLLLKPGPDVVERLGGLRGFTGWNGLFLTDSGGFQVFSLQPRIDDDGVSFRSHYDGDLVRLTPERAMDVQARLGADIAMVLDECPALPASTATVRAAVERTARWAERSVAAHDRDDQAVFGIVQGGVDADLRVESAKRTAELGFSGHAIGGLSVGEGRPEMAEAIAAAIEHLPADRPRYLMGVGDPAGLVTAIGLGVDMFDCVLPTRLGRHGTVLTTAGRLNLRNAAMLADDGPLDPSCACSTCARHSRAYLAHLIRLKEPTGARLVTIHNVAWTLALVASARRATGDGRFAGFAADVLAVWG